MASVLAASWVAVGCPARPQPHPERQSRTRRGMREIERLLNMRRNATTIIDLVALFGPEWERGGPDESFEAKAILEPTFIFGWEF